MNGWMRLWIFLSVIWAVLVVSAAIMLIVDEKPSHSSVVDMLSDESKRFYDDSTRSEGPKFTEVLTFADETRAEFEFIHFRIDPNVVGSFDTEARQVAENAGKKVSEDELRRFSSAVKQKHGQAAAAALEYHEATQSKAAEQRSTVVKSAALFLLPPPLALLILGYSIAWVRRGFQTAS